MTDFSNIDEQFREGQADWEGQPPKASWDHLSDRLSEDRNSLLLRKRRIYRVSTAASVTILLSIAVYMFNNSFQFNGTHATNTEIDFSQMEDAKLKSRTSDEVVKSITTESMETRQQKKDSGVVQSQGRSSFNWKAEADVEKSSNDQLSAYTPLQYRDQSAQTKSIENLEETSNSAGYKNANHEADKSGTQIFNSGGGHSYDLSEASESIVGSAGDAFIEEQQLDQDGYQSITSTTEQHDDEKAFILTDAVVMNQIGIEAEKKKQKTEEQRAKNSKEDKSIASRNEESKQVGRADQSLAPTYGTESQATTGNSGFTSTSLTILIPTENRSTCQYIAFLVENNSYQIDDCKNDKYDVIGVDAKPLDSAPTLLSISHYEREYLRELANQAKNGPCLSSSNSIQFIYRTGTTLSYHEEAINLPMQEFCLSDEAKSIVRDLKQLRERVGQ